MTVSGLYMENKKKYVLLGDDSFPYDDLDKRILECLRDGKSSKEIGRMVFRSHRNVEGRIGKMFEYSNTNKTISLVIFALRNKVIDL